jgi:hypothetical protein
VPNPRDFPVSAGESESPVTVEKPAVCRNFRAKAALHVLLAMQKVVGSNPISRFAKGLQK